MPFEMITMLGSTVLGGVMSIWSQSIKAKREEQKMLIQRAEVQTAAFKEAREYENTPKLSSMNKHRKRQKGKSKNRGQGK
jgi:hypothetical protein